MQSHKPSHAGLEGIEKTYQLGDVEVRALRGLWNHRELRQGSFVAIMGPFWLGQVTMAQSPRAASIARRAGELYLGGEDVSSSTTMRFSACAASGWGLSFKSTT